MEIFSETEAKVLKLLGDKKATLAALTTKYFQSNKKPMNPNAVISSAILRINRKCEYHNLEWFVNGSGGGRGGKTVWVDRT